ncbi:MAG: hypothetical protein HY282_15750 [Nitrospirae bacterium]|nr:hypothetical protein [Candidatus Manganitrophaceae bacterium]
MKCPKCGFPQYRERIDTTQGMLMVWRCIGCGNSTDQVILKNRARKRGGRRGAAGSGQMPRLKKVD